MKNSTNNSSAMQDRVVNDISKNLPTKRDEMEAKFLVEKKDAQDAINHKDNKKYLIEQIYLPVDIVESFLPEKIIQKIPKDLREYSEWRIRKKSDWQINKNNDNYYFTCKRQTDIDGVREEHNPRINKTIFNQLKNQAIKNGVDYFIKKIRYTRKIIITQQTVTVDIDEYLESSAGKMDFDFVTCELEVESVKILDLIRRRNTFHPELTFLCLGLDVTGESEFSNKCLAQYGFTKSNFNKYKKSLKEKGIIDIVKWACENPQLCHDLEKKKTFSQKIEQFSSFGITTSIYNKVKNQSAYIQAHGGLQSLAFKESDSLGRPTEPNDHQKMLDKMGYGWLKDFHTIVSSDPYLRLSWKPQIFRPGLGHNNTTTRGAHTLDVISCASQISRQLGLNTELSMAIAALHDIGHPAGGHMGEKFLSKLSKKKFEHHIFSPSLAELFSMNLLEEVRIGASYHKSHGGKLQIPPEKSQEFGVVRIADKIAYVAWDFYDSVRNGFIRKEDIPNSIYETLGKMPLDWINTFIKAVVIESASLYNVSFSSFSKKIFDAFETAKNLIFNRVHNIIEWERLETDYNLVFEGIKRSFPDLDPVPIVAYMTDIELIKVANIFEALPKKSIVKIDQFLEQGFGFVDMINILKDIPKDDSKIYYNYITAKAKGKLEEF